MATLTTAGLLAAACAACGSSESDTDRAGATRTATTEVAERSDVDYSDLAGYGCEELARLLDDVVGPGDHEGIPHAESWTVGTGYKGGCAFEDAAVAIEIHLAEPGAHSLPWSLHVPDRAAEREERSVDVGDEAYLDSVGDGVALVARRHLVEVRLGAPISGGRSMGSDGMVALAKAILEPWPSGPGAQESRSQPEPPEIPLPAKVVRADLEYFDIEEFNEKAAEVGGDFSDLRIDPELAPTTFHVTFPASQQEVQAYCQELRAAGIDTELWRAVAEAIDVPAEQPSQSDGLCNLTDGEDVVVAVSKGIYEYDLTVVDWDGLLRQIRVCQESPERCSDG